MDRKHASSTSHHSTPTASALTNRQDQASHFKNIPTLYHPPANRTKVPKSLPDWFEHLNYMDNNHTHRTLGKKYIAIDCEMVGVGLRGSKSVLARVSLVNYDGDTLLDTFVAVNCEVTDYRTPYSGIRPKNLVGAPSFDQVKRTVGKLICGHKLVGHSIHHDLKALKMYHLLDKCCDTNTYIHLQRILNITSMKLSVLTHAAFNITIQNGSHDSVDDACATMLLFRLFCLDLDTLKC